MIYLDLISNYQKLKSLQEHNLIQEKLHKKSIDRHESIQSEKSIWNSNINLMEMHDWIKHNGMNNLKIKADYLKK